MDRSDVGKDFKVFAGNNNNSSGLISPLSFYFNRIFGFWIACLDAEKDLKHEYKLLLDLSVLLHINRFLYVNYVAVWFGLV